MKMLKILLVDDNKDDRQKLAQYLEKIPGRSVKVFIVERVSDFLENFTRFKPDMVFVDDGLAEFSSDSVITQLRQIEPAIAIVMLTGSREGALLSAAIRAGATNYLNKNKLSIDKLALIIDQVLQRQDEFYQQAELHAKARMLLAVEASPNGMIMVDSRGEILMINSAVERMFGYSRKQLLGNSIECLVPKDFRQKHPSFRLSYAGQPKIRAMGEGRELYGVRLDGSEFPVEIGLNPVDTKNEKLVLASIIDITQRKLQEKKLMDSLKEKELLLAEIHHRVKNNLQIIDSLLNIQLNQVGDTRLAKLLTESQNRIRSMAIIHQMLYESNDFSKVNINALCHNLVNQLLISYAIDSNKVDITIEIDAPCNLELDKGIPLALILNELISNVFKHAFPDKNGELNLNLKTDGRLATLIVKDNGIGLPENFEAIAEKSLGLQLVRLLSEQLGGEFLIYSQRPTSLAVTFDIGREFEQAHPSTDRH